MHPIIMAFVPYLMSLLLASNTYGVGHALYAIYERPIPWPPAGTPINHVIQTNGAWYDAYSVTLTEVKVGDIFRLRGHITFTNTSADRVYGECRLTVNNVATGTRGRISVTYKTPPVSNTFENESRDHAPVYCDGLHIVKLPGDFNEDGIVDAADYVVWRSGNRSPDDYALWKANYGKSAATTTFVVNFKLQSSASNPGGMAPTVLVENGHGHLVIEHYRAFNSFADATAAGARVLTDVHYQSTPRLRYYPSSPPVGLEYDTIKSWPDSRFAYEMDIPVEVGDRLRFFGMATCYPIYPNQVHDGPVLGIWMKDPTYTMHTLYSPWIAEGFSPAYTINPMWNDAVTGVITASGTNRYWLSVHGTLVRSLGVGGEVAMPLGYFYALRYRQQTSDGRPGGRYLTNSYEMTADTTTMPANGTWVPLISQMINVESEQIIKLSGAVLFEHPGIVNDMVTTNMILRVRDAVDTIYAQTPISYKTMSKFTKYNSLRSDIIIGLGAGTYYFEVLANCPISGSPIITIDPAGTKLYYEGFGLPEGIQAPSTLSSDGETSATSDKVKKKQRKRRPRINDRSPRRAPSASID